MRHFGHLDVARLGALLRRAGLPLVMGQGCHPRPRISFPSALALGEAGWDEVLDAHIDGDQTIDEIHAAINECAPPGLTATNVEELAQDAPTAVLCASAYELPLPADRQAETAERLRRLRAQSTLPIRRDAPGDRLARTVARRRRRGRRAAISSGAMRERGFAAATSWPPWAWTTCGHMVFTPHGRRYYWNDENFRNHFARSSRNSRLMESCR